MYNNIIILKYCGGKACGWGPAHKLISCLNGLRLKRRAFTRGDGLHLPKPMSLESRHRPSLCKVFCNVKPDHLNFEFLWLGVFLKVILEIWKTCQFNINYYHSHILKFWHGITYLHYLKIIFILCPLLHNTWMVRLFSCGSKVYLHN